MTRANQIGLAWTAPVFEGGSIITGYQLWYDNASGGEIDTILEVSLTDTSYIAIELTQGATYQFKLEARNVYGLGFFSNVITILAAQEPA